MKKILFLASGRGSNFQSFIDHLSLGVLKGVSIAGLVSNRKDARALEIAIASHIPSFFIDGIRDRIFETKEERNRARLEFDEQCASLAQKLGVDYIVLAGFDQILTQKLTEKFPLRILNMHPAYDLRRFGGRNMVGMKVHQSVIDQKVPFSGCTVHFVTPEIDEGPVILKKKVIVRDADSAEELAARILETEHLVYPEAMQLLVDNRVIFSGTRNQCFVDRYSENWDVAWAERQESYIAHVLKGKPEEAISLQHVKLQAEPQP